jgi:hypothetical protein
MKRELWLCEKMGRLLTMSNLWIDATSKLEKFLDVVNFLYLSIKFT